MPSGSAMAAQQRDHFVLGRYRNTDNIQEQLDEKKETFLAPRAHVILIAQFLPERVKLQWR